MTVPTLGQRRAEKRKIEILEAALAVLSEDGYGSASMDKIAERALLTRVGLYKHFKDKSTLMVALREYKLLELAEVVARAVALETGFEAQLRAVVATTVQYQRHNQGFFHVLLSSSFSSDIEADLSLKPFLHTIAGVFELGFLEGRLNPVDPTLYAGMLTTLVFQPSIKRAFVPADFSGPPDNLAELISNVFLHGVLIGKAQ
jgi:AcrR family transcriptional regulator